MTEFDEQFNELNEGVGRYIKKGYKKYIEILSKVKNDFRYGKNGLSSNKLGTVGVRPFVDRQIKSIEKSYTDGSRRFNEASTEDEKVVVACGLFLEFINKFINADNLLQRMGFDINGVRNKKYSRSAAKARIEDIIGIYSNRYDSYGSRNDRCNKYMVTRNTFMSQVDAISKLGKDLTDRFKASVTEQIDRSGASDKAKEKAKNNLDVKLTEIISTWESEMGDIKDSFPSVIREVITSPEYAQYYSFIAGSVVPAMLNNLSDPQSASINSKTNNNNNMGTQNVQQNVSTSAQPTGNSALNEGAGVKRRGRKCTQTLQKMMDSFKNDEGGLTTNQSFGNIFTKLFSNKKQVAMGVKPFITEQKEDIKKDFDTASQEFNNVWEKHRPDNSSPEIKSVCSGIIYQFFSKYTNAEALLKKSGVNVNGKKIDDENAYDTIQNLLGGFNPKRAEKDGGLENFTNVRSAYELMVSRFDKLGKGIIDNFVTYTKKAAGEGGLSEKEINKLNTGAETLRSGWERGVGIMKNDFSSVMREIMASQDYTQYYDFVTNKVLPVLANKQTTANIDTRVNPVQVTVKSAADPNKTEDLGIWAIDDKKFVESATTPEGTPMNEDIDGETISVVADMVNKGAGGVMFYEVLGTVDDIKAKLEEELKAAGIEQQATTEVKTPQDMEKVHAEYTKLRNSSNEQDKAKIKRISLDDFIKAAVERLKSVAGVKEEPQGDQQDQNQGDQGTQDQNQPAAQPAQQQTQPTAQPANNQQAQAGNVSASYQVSYETPELNESDHKVSITRKITSDHRTRNLRYVVSECVWGDGRIYRPSEYLNESYNNVVGAGKTYGDVARVAKNSSSMRLTALRESATYEIAYPINNVSVLTDGNPLYEHVSIIEVDNTEDKNIVSRVDLGVHKITL